MNIFEGTVDVLDTKLSRVLNQCLDFMSGKNTDKNESEPRKKKRTKRKANSLLADTGKTGSETNKGQQAGPGKNRNNSQNVNIVDSGVELSKTLYF